MRAEGTGTERVRNPNLLGADALPTPSPALVSDLRRLVGVDAVSVHPNDRMAASTDMWPKAFLWRRQGLLPRPPDVVLFPARAEDVSTILQFAGERRIPVIPIGARSGVCGGLIPVGDGTIAVDSRRLSSIGTADPESLQITVGAGVIGLELEEALRKQGLTLGHYPASIGCSSIGGWLATRSGGQSSSRYGKIEDMVIGMECVLGTGEIVRPRRPAVGMDWIEIFAGSEGTLGFITEATFRLWPRPDVSLPRARQFPSMRNGLGAMQEILQRGNRPSVMRLYDPFDSRVALLGQNGERPASKPPERAELRPARPKPLPLRRAWNLAFSRPLVLNLAARLPRSALLFLVHEGAGGEAESEAREVATICERWGGEDLGEEPARRWIARRWDVSRKLPTVFELGGWTDTMEVAIGWGGVERLDRAVRTAVSPHAFVMAHFSHAYPDGCSIYFTFVGAAENVKRGLEDYDLAWSSALGAARREGATLTHHHGVGLFKSPWLMGEWGEKGLEAMAALRTVCDPQGIMNPGKLAG